MAAKAWGGAFDGQTDPRVERFTESISFDARLAEVDVRGSKAHSQMLSEVGLISEQEKNQIHVALDEILATILAGKFPFRIELEDIHMHIESALIERLGDTGRKLHTGRSRNDQVATDLKLYVRDAMDRLDGLLVELQRAFIGRAEHDEGVILPGYTHLQRAQPVLASQYWCAWCEKFERDRTRLRDARVRLNESPLGAAALAGTTLPINRQRTAELLGFDRPAANSLDISSDRDFVAETVFDLTLIATHLSNWAEEWILWCTTEFGFIKLPNAYTTGSSIMPQKRNPDVLELIRGKAGRVVGDLQHVLVLIKGLPLAYNRDLQEDKVALFDALDQVETSLELAAAIVQHAELKKETISARIEEGFLDATTLMEYLIQKGVPMRTGHETVGKLVRLAESKACTLAQLPLADFQSIAPQVQQDVFEALGVVNAVRRFRSEGSGGTASVAQQVARWKQKLEST